jgi:hypothetical protein
MGKEMRLGQNGICCLDFFLEAFNLTNEANFSNPTGDQRSGSFLIPTALQGGGFPRQYQLGARFGF